MSSLFLFILRKCPLTIITGRGYNSVALPIKFHSIKNARQSMSSSIDCGPPIQVPLLCHYRLSCAGFGTIKFPQTRSLAAPSKDVACLYSGRKLFRTGFHATAAAKLRGWDTWSWPTNLRQKQINQHFNLRYVYHIFNERLFHNLLSNVVLRWVEAPTGKLDWLSRTILISDPKRGPYALIEIEKPMSNGPWTLAIIQELLNAVLYEMTQVFYSMYGHNYISFRLLGNRARSAAQSGNRALFRDLVQEVEREANTTLKGLPRLWQLVSPHR